MITLIRVEFFHHPSGNSSVTGKQENGVFQNLPESN